MPSVISRTNNLVISFIPPRFNDIVKAQGCWGANASHQKPVQATICTLVIRAS